MTNKIKVAIITGAHGIKGQVTIHSFIDTAITGIASFFDASGHPSQLQFTGHKKNLLIASIDGITDRNAADTLKGKELFSATNDPALPAKNRLIGLPAVLADGSPYGTISEIYDFGAGEVAEISRTDGSSEMLPLKPEFIALDEDRAIIHPPEYLEADGS